MTYTNDARFAIWANWMTDCLIPFLTPPTRFAKLRSGRRPAPARPPPTLQPGVQQSMPSPFAQSTSNANGTTPQINPIGFGQQSNGIQGNQASASFPPTGASSNTGFNTTSFTAPSSSSFTFKPDQFVVNPFDSKANPDHLQIRTLRNLLITVVYSTSVALQQSQGARSPTTSGRTNESRHLSGLPYPKA